MIIAFRGSANARAWLTDFEVRYAKPAYADYGRVHRGFWESAGSVMGELLKWDQQSQPEVIITGHSKGAAEALICARRLADAGRQIRAVVTFGGPRVGNGEWQRGYNATKITGALPSAATLGDVTFRVVNQ